MVPVNGARQHRPDLFDCRTSVITESCWLNACSCLSCEPLHLQFNEMKNNCADSSHPRWIKRASVWPFTTVFPLNPVLEQQPNEKLQKFQELFYLKLLRRYIKVCLSRIPIHVRWAVGLVLLLRLNCNSASRTENRINWDRLRMFTYPIVDWGNNSLSNVWSFFTYFKHKRAFVSG